MVCQPLSQKNLENHLLHFTGDPCAPPPPRHPHVFGMALEFPQLVPANFTFSSPHFTSL